MSSPYDLIKGVFIIMQNEKEIWKDVFGYDGLYKVSNFGRVASTKVEMKILKLQVNRYGYTNVCLKTKYKIEAVAVHKLVAVAFLGFDNSQKALLIKHKDFDMKNNHVDNLFVKENKTGNKNDGVVKDVKTGLFVATIKIAGKTIYREEFTSKKSANCVYKQKVLKFIAELSQKIEQPLDQNKTHEKLKNYGFN